MARRLTVYCQTGNLDGAKSLLNKYPDIIDNFDEFSWCLLTACRNGHLAFAQWLLNIKPNICRTNYVKQN
jgi:hypothetical protein